MNKYNTKNLSLKVIDREVERMKNEMGLTKYDKLIIISRLGHELAEHAGVVKEWYDVILKIHNKVTENQYV